MRESLTLPVVTALAVTALATATLGSVAARAGDDITNMDEALAQAGTCIYPPGYVDPLAQGSMAPPRPPAPLAARTRIARALAARAPAGGMTPLPVPLAALIARPAGG